MSDEKRWLDGPSFFRWAVQERPYLIHPPDAVKPLPGRLNGSLFSERVLRSVHRWRDGSKVDVYGLAFEEFLMGLDLAEWEVPDEIWCDPPSRSRLSKEERYAIKMLARRGFSTQDICAKIGCSDRSVRTYS